MCGTLGAAWLGVAIFALVGQSGCYGDQCIGDAMDVGNGRGRLVSEDTWESNPQDDDAGWYQYRHERAFVFHPQGLEGRAILGVTPYISSDRRPNELGQGRQFTVASGNLAEIRIDAAASPTDPPTIVVLNDTCAEYWLRIVVTAYPKTDGGAMDAGDAGSERDSAPSDGATE